MFPSGSRSLGWGKAFATVAALSSTKAAFFWPPRGVFWGKTYVLFLGDVVLCSFIPLDVLVTKVEPTSDHHDVCSVGIPNGAFGRGRGEEERGRNAGG